MPGGRLSLRVFERRYVDLVAMCLKSQSPFGVCLVNRGAEVGAAAELRSVGMLAHVVECAVEQSGILRVSVRGAGRFRLRSLDVGND